MIVDTQKIPTGYKQTDIGMIPVDWDVKIMGDVGEIKMCRRIFNNETKESGAIPFYKIGTFGKEPDAFISQELYNEYRRRFSFPRKGDVLISAAGTIGRTIVYDGEPAYFQDSNIIWIDNNFQIISNEFLYYVLQKAKYNTEGGTIQRLYNSILNNTKFACPTKPEQSAIASALSDADALIEKLEKLIEKKKNIKQGAMQELLTGKRRLPGFSGEWETKTIEELEKMNEIKLSRGKVISKKDIEKFAGNFPIYSSSIHNNGEFGRYGLYMFDEELITWSVDGGGNFFYRNKHKFSVTNVCGYMRVNPEYLNYRYLAFQLQFLHSKLFFDYTMKAHPSVIRRAYSVNLPKLPEQIAIAKVLSDMDAEIENLESQLSKYQNLKQGMMQVLLTGKIRLI